MRRLHIKFQLHNTLCLCKEEIKNIYFSLVLLDLSGSNGRICGCEGWLVWGVTEHFLDRYKFLNKKQNKVSKVNPKKTANMLLFQR